MKKRFAFVAALVVAMLSPATVPGARAENTLLSSSLKGMSCVAWSSNWLSDDSAWVITNSSATYTTIWLKCNIHPDNTTNDNNDLAAIVAGGAGCGALVIACGTSSGIQLFQKFSGAYASYSSGNVAGVSHVKVTTHGRIVQADGTVLLGASSAGYRDNFMFVEVRIAGCSGCGTPLAGCNTDCDVAVRTSALDGKFAAQPNYSGSNTCGEISQNNAWQVCYGSNDISDWNTDAIYPDYWAGQEPHDPPCDGVDFELREDGQPLALPMGDGDESKTYVLRVTLPTALSDADTIDLWFDPDHSDAAGPRFLGYAAVPDTLAPHYVDYDVSHLIAALEDPTPDLSQVQAQCRSRNQVGVVYWDGETGLQSLIPPGDELEIDDDEEAGLASCFTLDGMSLTNPITWVRGIGRMGWCLVKLAFVPNSETLGEAFDGFVEELSTQLPFSIMYSVIDFGANFYDAAQDSAETGCFETGGSWSFGSYGSAAVPDVCIGEDVSVSPGQRQTLVWLMLGGLWFAVVRHAFALVRGTAMYGGSYG